MRAALISLAGQPRRPDGAGALAIGGKTLAHRQLEFALAADCERIIAVGNGASPDAIAFRHLAEGAGARFQIVPHGHGVLGAIGAADELIVIAPGLLPEAAEGLAAIRKGAVVVTLPAGPGTAGGFERIDLERAWAGVLVVPGALVEKLSALPPDAEPASALLRIALQGRVSEVRLPEARLAEAAWTMFQDSAELRWAESAWLKRHLPAEPPSAPSRWLARAVLGSQGSRLLAASRALPVAAGAAIALLAGAVLASLWGLDAIGFALVAIGAASGELARGLATLRSAPFTTGRQRGFLPVLPWLVDGAMGACAVLAIDGSWLHRLFPPLVLLGMLHLRPAAERLTFADFARDRAVLAVLFAIAAGFGVAEPAIMATGLALMALNMAENGGMARLTRT